MKNSIPKYDYKLLAVSIIILIILAVAFYFYWDITKNIIRSVLETRFTSFILWVITVFIFIVHYFRIRSKHAEIEPIITIKFGYFVDNIIGGITFATTITTSLTLLKGLYIQTVFGDKIYFHGFQDQDLLAIFGVALFLLYYAIMKVISVAKETYETQKMERVKNEEGVEVIQEQQNIKK